ncbi:MAG TPA: oligopeptidase B, partial [Acidobacteriaceae bacterium]
MPTTDATTPPIAEREPRTTKIHSTELYDDYGWMRDKDSPRVLEYLKAENAYTAAMMSGTEELQKELYEEILSHIKEDDVSVPYRDGAWEYLVRTEKGLQYPRYCRRPAGSAPSLNSTEVTPGETVILDVNQLAEGQPFMSVGDSSVSPDARLLAYTTDNTGFRQYTLHIKDLETGEVLADTAERVGSLAWAADSKTLLYSTEDEQTKRQDRLFRHRVGDQVGADVEVFHEPDERFNLGVGRTRDRKYLLMQIGSHTTSETWFVQSATPEEKLRLIAPRVDDEEYYVDHREGFFYVRSNRGAEQFKLMRTRVDATAREDWEELLPEQKDAPLEDFDLFQRFLVGSYRERGLPVLRVFSMGSDGRPEGPRDIRFPDPAYTAFSEINRDFNAT